MNSLRAAAQQALEALENPWRAKPEGVANAITALRAALAENLQEPVAWRTFDGEGGYDYRTYEDNENYAAEWSQRNPRHTGWIEPLYTSPLQRKPLTDEEATAIAWVGPVYAPDGVVTRTPTAYRRELERTRMDAIRRTEAAHGIGSKT